MSNLLSTSPTLADLQNQADQIDLNYGVLSPLTIVSFGPLNVTLDGSQLNDPDGQAFPVAHGLGYAPLFQVYVYDQGSGALTLVPVLTTSGAGFGDVSLPFDTDLKTYADTTNLYVVWHGHAQQPQQQFYYVIYSNPIIT